MEQKNVIVQKLKFVDDSVLDKAIRYYKFLFAIYGVKLPAKELELFAFTAVRGTITPLPARKEFAERFNSSLPSIENIKGRLVRKGLLIQVDGKYKVTPKFLFDFNKEMVVRVDFKLKENDEPTIKD